MPGVQSSLNVQFFRVQSQGRSRSKGRGQQWATLNNPSPLHESFVTKQCTVPREQRDGVLYYSTKYGIYRQVKIPFILFLQFRTKNGCSQTLGHPQAMNEKVGQKQGKQNRANVPKRMDRGQGPNSKSLEGSRSDNLLSGIPLSSNLCCSHPGRGQLEGRFNQWSPPEPRGMGSSSQHLQSPMSEPSTLDVGILASRFNYKLPMCDLDQGSSFSSNRCSGSSMDTIHIIWCKG